MQIIHKFLNFIYKNALFSIPLGCILALILLGLLAVWMSTLTFVVSSGLSESYLYVGNAAIGWGTVFTIIVTPLVAVSYMLDRMD